MSIGSKVKLILPHDWAYGLKGTDIVPPKSMVSYTLYLYAFRDKSGK